LLGGLLEKRFLAINGQNNATRSRSDDRMNRRQFLEKPLPFNGIFNSGNKN
jgi:hypothetical protein